MLRSGEDESLIGLDESIWLDAKGQPYRLDDPGQKWELAKDVSAMANASGGCILIAAKTEKPETYLEERIKEIVPVPRAMIDVQQYLDTIQRWTFPSLGHRVKPQVFDRKDDRVLLLLEIQPAPSDEQPVLVRTLVSRGGHDQIEAWAVARRVGTGTEWISAGQIWADIRDGRLSRSRPVTPQSLSPEISPEDEVERTASDLIQDLAVEGQAVVGYVAIPQSNTRISSFYTTDGVMGLMRDLPQHDLRRSGFGLGYGVHVKATDDALVDIEEGRRGLLVTRAGRAAAVAAANAGFLGWASERAIPPANVAGIDAIRLNPYVLAEYALEFARFVHLELGPRLNGPTWTLGVVARNLKSGIPMPYVPSNPHEWMHQAFLPVIDNAVETFPSTGDVEVDAYELLRLLVQLFGLPESLIPFVTDGRIRAETILAWR